MKKKATKKTKVKTKAVKKKSVKSMQRRKDDAAIKRTLERFAYDPKGVIFK